jgi:alpha-L-rhamnosidase
MYRTITGIDTQEDGVGYKLIIIKPQPGGSLTSAKATLQTNYGLLASGWTLENGQLRMEIEIPVNTSATIYFPTDNADGILENGQRLSEAKGIQFSKQGTAVTVKTGSGKYVFTMPMKLVN